MKFLILTILASVSVLALGIPSSTYTDKWDNIDVNEILESKRLLRGYVDCLLDKGRCTPDAKTLKETLPDALENECSKCTQKQKEGSEKVIRHLINKTPELWEELSSKYDPDHIYQEKYKDKLESVKD